MKTTELKNLETFNPKDIPPNTLDHPIIYKQQTNLSGTLEDQFGENIDLTDVWDDIYVFVYDDQTNNEKRLLMDGLELIFLPNKPDKLFNLIPINKGRGVSVQQNLPGFITLDEPKQLKKEELKEMSKDFITQINNSKMPWFTDRNKAIRAQNTLNHIIKSMSKYIPYLHGDSIQTHTFKDVFNRIYQTVE